MKENKTQKFSEKDILKMSKGRLNIRFYRVFLGLASFFIFAFIVFIILAFVEGYLIISYLIISIISLILGALLIAYVFGPRHYSKKTIDLLNEQLFKEGFSSIKTKNNEYTFPKSLLKDLKVKDDVVESIDGSTLVTILDKQVLVSDIVKASNDKIKEEEIFKGTCILISEYNFDILSQVEIRKKDSILEKSYVYKSPIKINDEKLNSYKIYAQDENSVNLIKINELEKVLEKLNSLFSSGFCIVFNKKRIVLLLNEYHISSSYISYKDIFPGKTFLKKKEEFNKIHEIIKEIISLYN